MKEKFKAKLKGNGQSLKWFWTKNLKGFISYNYFNMQINDNATMQPLVEKSISDFMIKCKEQG